MNKAVLLDIFRANANEALQEILKSGKDYKSNASEINKKILRFKESLIKEILEKKLTNEERLNAILLTTYVCNVVMLEHRNIVWEYDYMTFSRRIGEIWEPFCKLPFEYPVKKLQIYNPPKFDYVKDVLKKEIENLIENTDISINQKEMLGKYYEDMWNLIDSGSISLSLDLHFIQDNVCYDIDYKSGFSSNEKGNTNRLLLVASIYQKLPEQHKTLIFVRQEEEENNHYLKTLKNSRHWQVFCADKAYGKINEFTGFDLKGWMDKNMEWQKDISPEFKSYLDKQNLLKYLTW